MRTRTQRHKRTVQLWITVTLSIILWIGLAWWLDTLHNTDVLPWMKLAFEWMDDQFFLLELGLLVVYFGIIWVIIHVSYKFIHWVVGLLMQIFYR